MQPLEASQGDIAIVQFGTGGAGDLDGLDRMVTEAPDHDLGGLLGAGVLPLRLRVVEPEVPPPDYLERQPVLRCQVVKCPGVTQFMKDHPLLQSAARRCADVDHAAAAVLVVESFMPVASGRVGM